MTLRPEFKRKIISVLRECPGLCFAILYGSAAQERPFRDIDIALFVDRAAVPPENDLDYALDVTNALENAVPYPIDAQVINDAPLPFRFQVSQGIPLVARDKPALFRFLERTWDLYLDFQPVATLYLKEQP